MEKKQTAVELLILKYKNQWDKNGMGSVISYSELITDLEQAKEMEKEQIIDAFNEWQALNIRFTLIKGEQYYNETFKNK